MISRVALAVSALLFLGTSSGHAAPGECLLQVEQGTYLNGSCNIALDAGGSLTIWRGKPLRRSGYIAAVVLEPGKNIGYASWNGRDAKGPADQELGTMVRDGGCWVNNNAKICAWRPGTRPR